MPRFKDQAICLRQFDWSETSQVAVLLTEQHGILRGLAKGSKRQSPSHSQRFSGGIGLLTLGQVVATTRRTWELAVLTEWDLQNDFFYLRRDLAAQRLAMYAADVTAALLGEHDPHPRTFAATSRLLESLSDAERRAAALLRFQWDLLEDAGFKPELKEDVHTRRPLTDAAAYTFDPVAGGLSERDGIGDWRVRKQTVEVLRALEDEDAEAPSDEPECTLKRAPGDVDAAAVGRANRLLCTYARAILDRQLPTMAAILA